jgi:hypothetical protein
VYFRQVEDVTSARGYYQKSFVLFSSSTTIEEPLLAYARSIGHKFFIAEASGCGMDVLVDALDELNKSTGLSLPVPRSSTVFDDSNRLSARTRLRLTLGDSRVDVPDLLYSFTDALWHLWESIMVGLPILVYAGEPDVVCHLVTELTRLVAPYRVKSPQYPYLSIFDPEYKRFIKHIPSGSLVGVTSPMAFENLRDMFSILVCVGTESVTLSSHIKVSESPYGTVWISDRITSVSSGTRDRMTSIMRNWSPISTEDSSYRLWIPSEGDLVRTKLVASNINDDEELTRSMNRGIFTNYFQSLTRDFLIPFLKYIELDSSGMIQNPASKTPVCPKFSHAHFLSTLSPIGFFAANVPSHKIHVLYDKFIQTSQFHEWLLDSQETATIDSIVLHAKVLREKFIKSTLFVERVNSLVNLIYSLTCHKQHPDLERSLEELINLLK